MQTVEQWLAEQRFRIGRLHRGDMRFLLEAPCNEVLNNSPPARPFYVEIERKTQAPESYKLGHRHVHGFGRWKWERFSQAKAPVWLMVAEALSGELLALKVGDVDAPDDEFNGNTKGIDRGGMVYLLKSRFALLANLDRPGGGQRQLQLDGFA
jgi:hypothetical protein